MNKKDFLSPLIDILRIPSVSTQEKYKKEMQVARIYFLKLFSSIGFRIKLLKGEKHDAVFAQLIIDRSLPTVLIYGHYDVQPAEPLEEWKTLPFEPKIKGDKIIARGSADNKGQIMIQIMAVKNILSENKKNAVNFKFLIEGEEEIGSPSIENFAKKYSNNLLKCDYLIVSDTDMPKKGQPAIDISLRGLLYTEISLQTSKHDVHSGTFGGVAENPAILLAQVIAKLKDENGKIKIPHFYDDVVISSKKEVKEIRKNSEKEEEIMKEGELFGTGGGERNLSLDERKWIRPTLDVNGIWSGYLGEGSKTIIPAKASAKISMRLVPNQKPDRIYKLFERYVKSLLPSFVKLDIKRLADCFTYQAPTKDKVYGLMEKSLKKVYKKNPVFKRVSGSIGFVPIMAKALNVPIIMVGFALPDSNIHGPNEWFSLSNYHKGIKVMEDFYKTLARGSLKR